MQRRIILVMLFIIALSVALLVLLLGCTQEVDVGTLVNVFTGADNLSPVLVSVQSFSSSVVQLEFNEPVKIYGSSFEPFSARADGKYVYVTLDSSLEPGVASSIQGRVRDYSGNTVGFSVKVWGFNPSMPQVLINEFTTKGTERSPDRTELLVLGNGNVNGLTLYSGTPDDHDCQMVMGDFSVRKGDLIVVWWTSVLPDGVVLRPSQNVFNVCAETTDNPSSNNGAFVLCDTPSLGARVLDAVIYSNYSSSYEGYGTRSARDRAKWVLDSGNWEGDPIDSTTSTATRSICRVLDMEDTDTIEDWFVTVTGGATFGSANTSQAY